MSSASAAFNATSREFVQVWIANMAVSDWILKCVSFDQSQKITYFLLVGRLPHLSLWLELYVDHKCVPAHAIETERRSIRVDGSEIR